jgi:hypothetical protein
VGVAVRGLALHLPGFEQDGPGEAKEADDDHDGLL